MHDLEVLAVVPCTLSYDPVTCDRLAAMLLTLSKMAYRTGACLGRFYHWLERGLRRGFGFSCAFVP